MCSAGAIPEVVSLTVDTIRGGYNLDEIAPRDLNGRNFGRGKTDEVGEHAADNGGVPDDEQVFFLALQLDECRFQAN